ncbi:MAG: GNAT family N-acetyltransferase [Kofleriaceae bacterium]
MTEPTRQRVDWKTSVGRLSAREATLDDAREHAAVLSDGYNHPSNADLMGHTAAISRDEVVDIYAGMLAAGTRPFLLFCDDVLVGDADLRGFTGGAAEFAFMIAAPAAQGKGLGTRFATMIAAFGFRELGLARIFASVVPRNAASRRAFEKVGYRIDDGAEARAYADEPDDVVFSIDRERFEEAQAAALAELQFRPR